MKLLLFFLGLSLRLLKANLSCYSQGLSLDLSFNSGSDIIFTEAAGLSTCDDADVCGVARYDIDVSFTTNSTEWWADLLRLFFGKTISASYKLNYETCVDNATCYALIGGDSGCRTTRFVFDSWIPTSCDEATNYDAIILSYNSSYDYACCTSDKCNSDSYGFSDCKEENSFANYVDSLFSCWNDEKKTFMKYLVCAGGQDIYNLVQTCYVSDSYNWANVSCSYSLTCSDQLQKYLTQFGDCACNAATSNGYSGVLLADFLQTQWQTYCPNIELSCSSSGALQAYMTYYYVYYSFYLGLAYDAVTADVKFTILEAMANATRCNTSVITVDVTVKNSTYSQVTVTIQTQSTTDQSHVQSNANSNGNSYVSAATGATVTGEQTSTETKSTDIASSSSSSNGLKIQYSFLVFVIFAVLSLLL